MSIKKCCDNCIYFIDGIGEQNCCKNKNATISTPRVFIPKEDVVRKDERNKIITKLEEIKKIVDDNGKSYIISANLLMIIEMIKEREYEKEN